MLGEQIFAHAGYRASAEYGKYLRIFIMSHYTDFQSVCKKCLIFLLNVAWNVACVLIVEFAGFEGLQAFISQVHTGTF